MTAALTRPLAPVLVDALHALRLGPATVGGKALSLAALDAAGERVPEWLVLPADALAQHLRAVGAESLVSRELNSLSAPAVDRAAVARVAAALEPVIDGLVLSPELTEALAAAAHDMRGPFAVRSSAVGEDGGDHSFAGQFDTMLGVDAAGLAEAVRRCWRSAFSVRALDYRRRTGTLGDATRLAVIVQRQVAGDVSGVLFTIDPMSGDTDKIRVSACRGLGDALVSGAIDADEYLLARDGTELGASRVASAHRLLEPTTLRTLAALGERLSRHRGARDIEWTIRDGELWVLQDRPVTAVAKPAEAGRRRIVWDNCNIQESYCGVTTPLTFSFARDAYASVYEQTMRAVGIPEATIAAHRPTLRTLLGLLQGRVYYNLNSWYTGLLLLPAFRRHKDDMERMMGVEEPVDFVADETLSFAERLRRIPRLAGTIVRLLIAFATLDRDTGRFLSRVDGRLRAIDRAATAKLPVDELMPLLEKLRTDCIERWTTPIVNDFHVMMSVGRLRRFVARALPHSSDSDVDVAMQQLLGGAAVAVAAAPAALMLRLAEIARDDATVREALVGMDGGAALAAACDGSTAFAETLRTLLDEYGDRCMGELKLESRSLRDDPGFVVRMTRNYLGQARAVRAAADGDDARSERRAVEIEIAGRLGPFARQRFRRALHAARTGIARRETLRLVRTRLFGVHRDIYRAVGHRFHERGRLDRPDDIFFLATEEIRGDWEGTGITAGLAELARARRREFAEYEKVAPPNRVVTTGAPHEMVVPHAPRPTIAGRLLRGLGCSAGVAEGIVRIVRAPTDDLAIDGHILVAPRTDPGWAPLFPSARAIVVERGSLLSHSAVLARELGLPAVVGFPGILETLRDGERVRIDGSAGTIERLDLPCTS